jgi:hypothetical protein
VPARRRPTLTTETILPGLHPLLVPLDWIEVLPGNPRRGKVEAIAKSLKTFGQRKPVVVTQTGERDGHPIGVSSAGNHTLLAMRSLEWVYGAVVWTDDDETTAKAWSMADNQTHTIGGTDPHLLAQMVADVAASGPIGVELLESTGFTGDELSRMIRSTMQAEDPTRPSSDGTGGGGGIGLGTPVISTTIVFETSEQQNAWYALQRHLRVTYPDADTTGERIAMYVIDMQLEG